MRKITTYFRRTFTLMARLVNLYYTFSAWPIRACRRALPVVLLMAAFSCSGQLDHLPSPEQVQMYLHGVEFTRRGDWPAAANVFKQGVRLFPEDSLYVRGLGIADFHIGNYEEAAGVLRPLQRSRFADAEYYAVLAQVKAGQNKLRDALQVVDEGIRKFPDSSRLHSIKASICYANGMVAEAFAAWRDCLGIMPCYAPAWRDCANALFEKGNTADALLCGEICLYVQPDTLGSASMKLQLLSGYRKLFDAGAQPSKLATAFFTVSDTVRRLLLQLAPVVSDGVTTENLMMLRTRFIMELEHLHKGLLRFPLFALQLRILRSGMFDIGTEWLFGKAEDLAQYTAWTQFHAGAIDSFSGNLPNYGLAVSQVAAFLGKPAR